MRDVSLQGNVLPFDPAPRASNIEVVEESGSKGLA